jgi:hypothetical protein
MSKDPLKVELLFHVIPFSYQRVVRDILHEGSEIFIHPTLSVIRKVSDKLGIDLEKGETIDEVFETYSKMLQSSGLMKETRFRKLGPRCART